MFYSLFFFTNTPTTEIYTLSHTTLFRSLDDPESFKSKEVSKLGVLEHILQPDKYPDLYEGFTHVVRINYYPPRGDRSEEHTSELQSQSNLVCRLLLEKKKKKT